MADNLNITSGSGVVVKTDEIGGVHYQQIKLVDGNLESTSPVGVKDNPLIVSVQNTGGTVLVSGNISVINTVSTVSISNFTGGTVSIINTGGITNVSGGISVLNTGAYNVTVLNTAQNSTVLNTDRTVTVLNTNNNSTVLNTNRTISNVVQVSGGFTLLSSIYLNVNVNTFTAGTVSLLNTATPGLVTGGVSILSMCAITVTSSTSGGVTTLSSCPIMVSTGTGVVQISGGVSLLSGGTITATTSGGFSILSSCYLNVNINTFTAGTVSLLNTATPGLVTGGVSLLSSSILTIQQGSIAYNALGYTPTWIYAALSSNNQTVVWKPVAAKRFNITDITLNVKSASTVTITQDTAATVTLMKLNLMDRGGWVSNLNTPIIASQTNHGVVVTSTEAGTNSFIFVAGYESV